MRFAFTDEQRLFGDAARDVLEKESRPEDAWASLAEMGLPGLLVPEADGGLGLDEVWLVPPLMESGRAAFAPPLVETAAVAAPLIGTGRTVATNLGGPLVPWAAGADALLLREGDGLWLLEPAAVKLEEVETVDRDRRAARVTWSPADGELVTDDPAVVQLAFDRGALGVSAQLCGLASHLLDVTVGYVKERKQFGVPVGSFQAVKHHLANALLALEFAKPPVAAAAWSLAQHAEDASRDVSMAKAMASDAAQVVARAALQCHGAIGYTTEYDLHRWMKRVWALARWWGDAAWHRDRVGTAIGI